MRTAFVRNYGKMRRSQFYCNVQKLVESERIIAMCELSEIHGICSPVCSVSDRIAKIGKLKNYLNRKIEAIIIESKATMTANSDKGKACVKNIVESNHRLNSHYLGRGKALKNRKSVAEFLRLKLQMETDFLSNLSDNKKG